MSLFEDTYITIESKAEGNFRDRGSKFLAFAFPVSNEEEVKEKLAELRKEYHDARHHCYAYRLGHDKSAWRINDDGEPSGTAGRPIYGQLLSNDLTNVLVVVVRYFGGTKLGVSGLINAYKTATADALSNATVIEKTVNERYNIQFEYPVMNEVMRLLKEFDANQRSQQFDLSCSLEFGIRKSSGDALIAALQKVKGLKLTFIGLE
ncbi:MAG: YigZ family protein [Bacteroidetes bacterium]|nr:YigZ family protein [Bacteroidota bacterium]MBU1720733.1 YigZ family protein [Bacteroidota bacterium]